MAGKTECVVDILTGLRATGRSSAGRATVLSSTTEVAEGSKPLTNIIIGSWWNRICLKRLAEENGHRCHNGQKQVSATFHINVLNGDNVLSGTIVLPTRFRAGANYSLVNQWRRTAPDR